MYVLCTKHFHFVKLYNSKASALFLDFNDRNGRNNCPHLFGKEKTKQMWNQGNNWSHLGLDFLLLLSSRHLTQLLSCSHTQVQVCTGLKIGPDLLPEKYVSVRCESSLADCVHRSSLMCDLTLPHRIAGRAAKTTSYARTSSLPGRRNIWGQVPELQEGNSFEPFSIHRKTPLEPVLCGVFCGFAHSEVVAPVGGKIVYNGALFFCTRQRGTLPLGGKVGGNK